MTPAIVQECHEADVSATLLPGNSHFVPFPKRVQIVIRLMPVTEREMPSHDIVQGGKVHCILIGWWLHCCSACLQLSVLHSDTVMRCVGRLFLFVPKGVFLKTDKLSVGALCNVGVKETGRVWHEYRLKSVAITSR